jgi:hypothetical protein
MSNKKHKSIKETLKPRAGKIRQGYFIPKNPSKYDGDITQIIYRSGWEFKFLKYCDENDKIVKYSSEPVGIKYYNPISKKTCRYWVDMYIAIKESDGTIKNWILEIKPLKYTKPPKEPKYMTEKQTRQYLSHAKTYIVNRAKFEAAKDYADSKGIQFGIITENFLFKSL